MLYLVWLGSGLVGACAGWCAGQVVAGKIVFAYLRRSMNSDRA